ncbi:MAG: TerB family tellurite resistance protein, partial [Planctomycetes bacterium]|nr:TerB family tellurite resistance protein [Planctomycetota bacterium]
MKLEEAAFVNLVVLARADGLISSPENELLQKYREVLCISEKFARELSAKRDLKPIGTDEVKAKQTDRMQMLKMMIRVAYADGDLSQPEKRLIIRMALSFGVGRIALKGLFWEIERELGIKRKLRLSQIVAVATVIVAAITIWFFFRHFQEESRQRLDQANINLDEIKIELGLEKAKAEEALRGVRDSQENLARKEIDLEKRIRELDQKSADERASLKTVVTEEQENKRT